MLERSERLERIKWLGVVRTGGLAGVWKRKLRDERTAQRDRVTFVSTRYAAQPEVGKSVYLNTHLHPTPTAVVRTVTARSVRSAHQPGRYQLSILRPIERQVAHRAVNDK